jgi:hypothetical protein
MYMLASKCIILQFVLYTYNHPLIFLFDDTRDYFKRLRFKTFAGILADMAFASSNLKSFRK